MFCLCINISAQPELITELEKQSINTSTAAKPQSKVWQHNGNWYCVFPKTSGTKIWKLDGDEWIEHLHISSKSNTKADCVAAGDTTFIMLFQKTSSEFTTVIFNSGTQSYEFMHPNIPIIPISFSSSTETAVIDIDGVGILWMTYEASNSIYVRTSVSPYTSWSAPYSIASGVKGDDISSVIKMNGKIGVFWSDQNTELFGFKTHNDGDPISVWSADEQPASQGGQNAGNDMADDHMNLKFTSDGKLYCAIKTSYDASGEPSIGLLIRNSDGSWDDLYPVSNSGSRPICIIDEINNAIKVLYTDPDAGGNIVYRQSSLNNINFGSEIELLDGTYYNNASSTKRPNLCEVVVIAAGSTNIVGAKLESQSCDCVNHSSNSNEVLSSNVFGATFVIQSPNGACWQISIDNAGNIRSKKAACPQ